MKKSVLIPFDRYQYLLNQQKSSDDKASPERDDIDVSSNTPTSTQTLQQSPQTRFECHQSDKLDADIIRAYLPSRNRGKATALLKAIENHPHINWNDKGELLIKEKAISGSHICDILHDALNNTKHEPVGCRQFYRHLTNVPQSLITNPNRRSMIGGENTLPPPGLPNLEPKPFNPWRTLWKAL